MTTAHNEKTEKVENWWNTNPFTYNGSKGVGRLSEEASTLDIDYFDTAERKYKKHTNESTQTGDTPVFSKYIEYEKLRGKKVLDIATGTGFSTVTFARFGADVTGIDLTEYAVAQTKRNFELRGLTGTILQMDAQVLEFPDNTFDFVCAHGCLMHMPDTKKAIREIYRVLKPGGTVYAWMYHKGWYYWFGILFLRGVLLGKLLTYKFSTLRLTSRYSDGAHEGGNPHTRFYSRREFRDLFSNEGFSQVEVFANNNPQEWDAWPMAKLKLGFLIPRSIQKFFGEKVGFALSCSILARKN